MLIFFKHDISRENGFFGSNYFNSIGGQLKGVIYFSAAIEEELSSVYPHSGRKHSSPSVCKSSQDGRQEKDVRGPPCDEGLLLLNIE